MFYNMPDTINVIKQLEQQTIRFEADFNRCADRNYGDFAFDVDDIKIAKRLQSACGKRVRISLQILHIPEQPNVPENR